MEPNADIALIGLAVMGQNLIMNMNDHGFTVAAFNRTVAKVDEFLAHEAKGSKVIGAHSIEEMVKLLKRPRRIMLMVKAGKAVDEFIEHLLPHLEPGDIIIDGGNSLFDDTNRRVKYCESKGLLYIGTGVSGGEEGARRGPLRQDGPQRHRIRRHAVDLRGLQHHEERPRLVRRRDARGLHRMEQGRPR